MNTTSRLSSVTYPSGTGLSTLYTYYGNTGDQRLETIQNLNSTTQISKFSYTYNAVGTIATWTQQADSSTAVVNTLSYDGADQLTSAVQSGGGSASNAYAYDPAGNRLAETTASGTTAGQFNNVNQLTAIGTGTSTTVAGHTSSAITSATVNEISATISNSTNFTANVELPVGTNIVSVVAQPTSGSAATQREKIITTGTLPTALTYDANGNTLTDENGNTYKWDALNRLTAIIYPGGTHTEFAYDGLSRRTSIVERAGTTIGSGTISSTKNFIWVGSEIAEERDASNTVTKRFFPQGEQQSGTDYYYTRDHLGSVREMCSSTGTITSRMAYDPYGRTTLVSGSNLATKQYAGMYMHQTSGLYLTPIGNTYDPTQGRWIGRDPLGERASLNLYAYVHDNPINMIDPLGLIGGGFHTDDDPLNIFNNLINQNPDVPSDSGNCPTDSPPPSPLPPTPPDWLTQFENWWDSLGISSQDAVNDAAVLASMGSTGRTAPTSLTEQLAMEQAMSNPAAGTVLKNIVMNDPRWPASAGWVKMEQKINGVTVHYVRNTITGAVDDFKFK